MSAPGPSPLDLPPARLSPGRASALVLRSFFLQAAWSYERMQSVGLAAALGGEGRRLAPGPRAPEFLRRHLAYFNTNPPLAGYILGGVVRLEEEVAAGRAPLAVVERFKRGVTSPLAAWGDALFWATLRPAATAAGAVAGFLAGAWGVLVYLLAYNLFHIYYRVRGPAEGYRWGPAVAARLGSGPLRTLPGIVRPVGLGLAGALAVLGLSGTRVAVGDAGLVAVLLAAGIAGYVLRRRAGSGGAWGLVAVAAGLFWVAGAMVLAAH